MAKKRNSGARLEEVTDLQAEPTQARGMDMSAGLIFVTFVALLLGIILSQFALKKYFDAGLMGLTLDKLPVVQRVCWATPSSRRGLGRGRPTARLDPPGRSSSTQTRRSKIL